MRKIILFFPLILFVIDRIVKEIAPSIYFEGDFIKFGFYKNYAGAFSLPIAGWLYNSAGIILLFIFIYLFFVSLQPRARHGGSNLAIDGIATPSVSLRARNDRILLSYLFIILGGISNLFDRLYYGYTIDYANFMDISFFNLADGMLIMGIATLLHCYTVKNKKQCNNVTM